MRDTVQSAVYTVPQAGEYLGLSRPGAYAAAKRGDIPTIRIGRRIVVPKAALERMLDCAGQGAKPDAA